MPEISTDAELVDTISNVTQNLTLIKIGYAILLLLACIAVTKVLLSILDRSLDRFKVEKSLHTFIKSSVKILLGFLTICFVGDYLGIPMTSLVAVLSIAGLAVSLSIQGTLSNLAGGIMVLVSKPFCVGDYIEAGGVAGVVADIGMAYTKMNTLDNKIVFVPNGQISVEKIVNYTGEDLRRVDIQFDIAYESDPEAAKAAIMEVAMAHPLTVNTPAPFVRVLSYGESSVGVVSRVWCKTGDYWTLYADMMEQVRVAFDKVDVELTYNHVNVHIMGK